MKDKPKLDMSKIGKMLGQGARRNLLRTMLFSGIEFKDFKGMAKCNPIIVR